jgi:hypothetical protein
VHRLTILLQHPMYTQTTLSRTTFIRSTTPRVSHLATNEANWDLQKSTRDGSAVLSDKGPAKVNFATPHRKFVHYVFDPCSLLYIRLFPCQTCVYKRKGKICLSEIFVFCRQKYVCQLAPLIENLRHLIQIPHHRTHRPRVTPGSAPN